MIAIRRLGADDWPIWRELRLAALGEAPYAFGSKLADWQGDGDREQRWRDRLAAAGMVSGIGTGGEVELISLWVAPWARGQGVADALVDAVVGWARALPAAAVALAVREGNTHAVTLYLRHGFVDKGPLAPEDADAPGERRMVLSLHAG